MPKWKMIGIRVPEESDLSARVKEMSEKTRLSYCELLEKLKQKLTFTRQNLALRGKITLPCMLWARNYRI